MVVVFSSPLRYDDGNTLKGIGTLASKSRLATFWCEESDLLEFLSKGRQEGDSCFFVRKGEKEDESARTLSDK